VFPVWGVINNDAIVDVVDVFMATRAALDVPAEAGAFQALLKYYGSQIQA
jgi:hypothetical protein